MRRSVLGSAAEAVCRRLLDHAAICEQEPSNAAAVVARGEELRRAVRDYEAVLFAETGWSNPLRHLDAEESPETLHGVDEDTEDGGSRSGDVCTVFISDRFYLRIDSRQETRLLDYVSGRLGIEPTDVVTAIRTLYQSDSWDPSGYPEDLFGVDDRGLDVWIEPNGDG